MVMAGPAQAMGKVVSVSAISIQSGKPSWCLWLNSEVPNAFQAASFILLNHTTGCSCYFPWGSNRRSLL